MLYRFHTMTGDIKGIKNMYSAMIWIVCLLPIRCLTAYFHGPPKSSRTRSSALLTSCTTGAYASTLPNFHLNIFINKESHWLQWIPLTSSMCSLTHMFQVTEHSNRSVDAVDITSLWCAPWKRYCESFGPSIYVYNQGRNGMTKWPKDWRRSSKQRRQWSHSVFS